MKILMLDTETANTITIEDRLDMSNVLPYDIGWAVIDQKGSIYETASFVNTDIFDHEPDLMSSAYYARKIPQYERELENGTRIRANTYQIREAMIDAIKKHKCKYACAHNARFDWNALNNIQRWETKSKSRYWFPFDLVEMWDTMKMANSVISTMPTYRAFCEENGYMTNSGKPRKTAEILYRFIKGDNDFNEAHTGLEDALIEAEILWYCFRQHKKMERALFPSAQKLEPRTEIQKRIMEMVRRNPMGY